MPINGHKHVLDGYKALDFTQLVAGPTVTKLMAEMGAEVIKIELAPEGDRCRIRLYQGWTQRLLRPAESRQAEPLSRSRRTSEQRRSSAT